MPRLAFVLLHVGSLLVMDTAKFARGFSPAASIVSPHATLLSRKPSAPIALGGLGNANINSRHRHGHGSSPRSLPILQSAKVLPIAYTSASVALLYRSTRAASKQDAAFLLATAALSLLNLAPGDNVRLASAKAADGRHPPASSGPAKMRRQAAKTWRSAVRIKIVGQLLGLVWMAAAAGVRGRLRGGAAMMGANVAFFACGGGGAVHDEAGEHTPMPSGVVRSVMAIDAVIAGAAWIAASSPIGSGQRAVSMGIYTIGVAIGALEGLAVLLADN